MLHLLPVDFITVDVVDLIIGRWKSAFQQRPVVDKLRDFIVRSNVGPNPSFKKEFWCVRGKSAKTGNAAESSFGSPNASVRVSGEISLDAFLFAIEKRMRNSSCDIQVGCP